MFFLREMFNTLFIPILPITLQKSVHKNINRKKRKRSRRCSVFGLQHNW